MSCPDCFSGSVHEGKPRGEIIKFHGLDTYATGPADGRKTKAIIVIIPDAFGWDFVNNRILADHYADKGDYKVYLPDFMEGHSVPVWMIDTMRSLFNSSMFMKPLYLVRAMSGFIPFQMINRIGKSYPRVKAFFEALRKAEGADVKIGAAGFCWGGKHLLLMSHNVTVPVGEGAAKKDVPLINAGFTGHPSMLDLPADVADTMTVPVSFAIGEHDPTLSKEQAETIRKAVEGYAEPARGEVRIYQGCGHGFCVRADSTVNDVMKQAAEAEDQCIAWFNKHFGL